MMNSETDCHGLQRRIAELEEELVRERAEREAMRAREARYSALVDQATSDALLIHDLQGRLLEVNRRACETLGYTKEELLRMSVTDIELDFDLENAQSEWAKVEPGVPFTLYGRQKRKNGSVFPVEIHFGCTFWNGEKLILGLVRDITERKRAEDALRESEERFRGIVEGAPDAIFIQTDRKLAYLNPAACRLFGVSSQEELLGTPVLERFHPDYHTVILERIKRLNEDRQPVRELAEYRMLRMDMSETWVETRGEPLVYHGKQGALVFVRDVSWRKEAEAALYESEERFRRIFQDSLSIMFLLDPATGRFLDINRACEKFYGWSREELLEMRSQDINLLGERSIREIEKAVSEEQTRFEFKHRLADGSVRDVEVFTSRIFTRGKCMLYCIVNDITSRKSAQHRVRLLSRALEQTAESVIITDPERKIEYVNPAFTRSTGYSAEEVVGRTTDFLRSGEHDDDFHASAWRTLRSGETWNGELCSRRKDGELFWENVVISPIVDEKGALSHFIAIREDITERRKLLDSLVQAKERAEESDRLKSAFLHNMSHEIRTPMNGILGFLALLKEPALDEDEKNGYIQIVSESGKRLLNTINDIVEASRIEAGRTMPDIQDIDADRLMRSLENSFRAQAAEKGIALKLAEHLEGEEALVRTDGKKLNIAIANLLDNAVKFTRRGSVEFGNYLEGPELVFYVKDSGIGIPEDRMEAIFERFIQADVSNTRSHEGAGLGLTIAKANVEALGGRIWVSSEPGKGSAFSFSIPYTPLKRKTDTSDDLDSPALCDERNRLVILVAEDDPLSFHLVRKILQSECCSVLHSCNGEEAVKAVRENPEISLVLMDLKMPGMDGLEAVRRIRRFNSEIPVIAQTAYAFPEDRRTALEAGCDDYIMKPVDRTLLLKMVRRFCG